MTEPTRLPRNLRRRVAVEKANAPVHPEALAALLRAAHATTRQQVIHHLLDAVSAGLHAPDAMKALAEWDAAQTIERHAS